MIQETAFYWAMVLGGVMIVVSCFVFFKTQKFGIGGAVLTTFGVILVVLSIPHIKLSASPKEGIKFENQASYDASYNATNLAIKKEVDMPSSTPPTRRQRSTPASLPLKTSDTASVALPQKTTKTVFPDTYVGFKTPGKSGDNPISYVSPKEQGSPAATSQTLVRLKLEEQVQRYINNKEYLEAMKLDPNNVIPVMYYIEQNVLIGKDSEAVAYFPDLRRTNKSGVGYSAYPDVALAYERLGKNREAIEAITELKNSIAQDIAQGYGYLSRSQQLEWVDNSLAKAESLVSDTGVKQHITGLREYIKNTIRALKG